MAGNPLGLNVAEALDPVLFARRLGIEPDPWQIGVLRSTQPRVCLCCSRQVGKSTVSSVLALHTALFVPESLVLIAAPSQRQSVELFRTILRYYRALGRPVEPTAENLQSLSLENGSRIVSLPGDERTTRGYAAVRLLVIDEASRVPDEFLESVRPMLAVSGGRTIALSTPFGRRGWFWRAATKEPGWQVVQVRADECPRITAEFLEQERAAMGDWRFRQEYFCEFVAGASSFFDAELIASLSDPSVLPLFGAGGADVAGQVSVEVEPVLVVDEPVGAVEARAQARDRAFREVVRGRGW